MQPQVFIHLHQQEDRVPPPSRSTHGVRTAVVPVRARELQLVSEAIRDGRGVLLRGEAGIGKTTMLAEVLAAEAAAGRRVATLTANSAMSVIPLGALMSLLDQDAAPAASMDYALAARRGVEARNLEVLAIDDAHLLDAASAGVVHELAASGLVIVAAARAGLPLPDAITLIVKDLGAFLCEVPPLTTVEVATVVAGELGGEIDPGLAHTVATRSAGNPLAVRALLREGVERGVIQRESGVWRLNGQLPFARELVELMRLPIDRLSPAGRSAAELVALAEALPLSTLLGLAGEDAIDEGETAGVLEVGASSSVRVGHPLIRDALLAMLPTARRRSHLGRLSDALASSDDAVDRVAVAQWRLELGREVVASELLALAEVVHSSNPQTCEVLLRAAIERGAGLPTILRLAEVLAHQHRTDDSLRVLDSVDLEQIAPDAVIAVQLTRAFLLTMPSNRAPEAVILLDELRERFGSFPMLEAVTSTALWLAGYPAESAARAQSVIDDPASPAAAGAHARLTKSTLHAYAGNEAGFAAQVPSLLEFLARDPASLPEGEEATRLLAATMPFYSSLDLGRARQLARVGYARHLTIGDDGTRAQYGQVLGRAATISGDADEGVRLLREAIVARGIWCTSNLPYNRSHLVMALVLSGHQDEAEQIGKLLEVEHRNPYLDPEAGVAAAAILAGRGQLRLAAERAASAARSAPNEVAGMAALTWYEALRYRHPDAPAAFLAATASMPGVGREAQRAHAEAALQRDPDALEAAAQTLLAAGLGGYAVDAMAAAIRLHQARRDASAATHALERLRFIQAQLAHYDSPVARGLDRPALTAREAEVARLAMLGDSDRAIAETLDIGVRTVETHLSRVYVKLGVRGRDELGDVLRGSRPA